MVVQIEVMSFTPTFKYLGTIISWDLREAKDVEARIKSANKLFGSAKATFWSMPFRQTDEREAAPFARILLESNESSEQHPSGPVPQNLPNLPVIVITT